MAHLKSRLHQKISSMGKRDTMGLDSEAHFLSDKNKHTEYQIRNTQPRHTSLGLADRLTFLFVIGLQL